MATLARTQAVVVTDRRRPGPDLFLTAAMVALSGLGLLMVYTASRPLLTLQGDDPQGLVRRQLIFVGIGLVCFVVSSLIDYRLLKTLVPGRVHHFGPGVGGGPLHPSGQRRPLLVPAWLRPDPAVGDRQGGDHPHPGRGARPGAHPRSVVATAVARRAARRNPDGAHLPPAGLRDDVRLGVHHADHALRRWDQHPPVPAC